MAQPVIEVREVTKHFKVSRQPSRSLKEATIRLLERRLRYDNFVALDRVSLTVERGERVGIIGANGSGKSTLFKLIGGILRPSAGEVRVRGRISPLIELSAGFHPELTGIENIYLNGAIYGMRREQVTAKLEAITRFAGIGDFIHSPVRVYSSGMMVRLAFGLAINVDADILLIDEVLAVGDAEFQQRCLQRIRALEAEGVTIVYVSHDMPSVASICQRVIHLDRGVIVRQGAPQPVIDAYLQRSVGRRAPTPALVDRGAT